jgi:hypothetical protein
MIVVCKTCPENSRLSVRNRPAYLLRGEPSWAILVVRFPEGDRVVCADEVRALRLFFLNATDEELFLPHEGGYSIVD